jgi:hypothetical protein
MIKDGSGRGIDPPSATQIGGNMADGIGAAHGNGAEALRSSSFCHSEDAEYDEADEESEILPSTLHGGHARRSG